MTETQQYRVVADRDKGDIMLPPREGDRVTYGRDGWGKLAAVRIERLVPTSDEPAESLFGNIRVVTGRNLSVPSGATEGAIAVFPNPGIPDDLPIGTVFIELISGLHAKGLMSVKPAEPSPRTPAREHIAEASAEALRDVAYTCGRVWEAWQVGTMSEDDFAPAWEDDELTGSIADAVLALIQNGADR